MRRHSLGRWAMVVAILAGAACSSGVVEDMGPQHFSEPNIRPTPGSDKEISAAVDAAVSVADSLKLRYDASASTGGRVIVTALWKEKPVTLTMGFFKKDGALNIASSMTQPVDVAAQGGGEKIEALFYSRLGDEAEKRGLKISGEAMSK
jgi:hypothetical protein